ncbi:hypothetical protein FA13DRAFT_1729576 [Coprinellus micaceus]|uniref:Uncharacterized protein n=1 Tax=Coprinellus micaceus TaxID=71717 RepID=A0A4Y7TJE8_COPMI|nr:hypothetical protein FA13DRAFT_1729576 [Coprinellus micaceus]
MLQYMRMTGAEAPVTTAFHHRLSDAQPSTSAHASRHQRPSRAATPGSPATWPPSKGGSDLDDAILLKCNSHHRL